MPDDRDRSLRLDPEDATDLAEMLSILGDWLDGADADLLAASFQRFGGPAGYTLAELHADFGYFITVLEDNAEHDLGPTQH